MKLQQLLTALPRSELQGSSDVEIEGLTHDSRRVRPGDLFVAIKGLNADGHDYIPEAIRQGAVAVVTEKELRESPQFPPVPFVLVPDSRQALAHMAAAFYGYPARQLRVIGVTGTDGKTTTIALIRAILEAAGHPTGMISTVSAVIGGQELDTGLHTTTPEAPDVQRYLAQMVAAGGEYAVLEATSHGLDQQRVAACDFDVAAVTNITHEHLDYHGTYEAYREAKAQLFRSLAIAYRKPGVPKVAILNADDSSFACLRHISADRQISYGLDNAADVTARDVTHTPNGLRFIAETPVGRFPVKSPLLGAFNVPNILAAIAVGVSQGVPIEAMQEGVRVFRGVVGRMERVNLGQDFTVIIDFAHTPYSLERALETTRELTTGRVLVVFGCAGLRDRAKRPWMGEIAGRLADRVVITAEDPRTEDLNEIMAQIAAGCEKAGRREGADYWRIGDRGEAIAFAIRMAQPGDLVIVTGKGHERSMCFGTTEIPWSDHEAVREALGQLAASAEGTSYEG
ncbi:MAG: UDP-N-acetylmuramoyl-L-alanyl-D-glutamate--2,6-diaminopimelate ligase [Anaerolineae bacterium]